MLIAAHEYMPKKNFSLFLHAWCGNGCRECDESRASHPDVQHFSLNTISNAKRNKSKRDEDEGKKRHEKEDH